MRDSQIEEMMIFFSQILFKIESEQLEAYYDFGKELLIKVETVLKDCFKISMVIQSDLFVND